MISKSEAAGLPNQHYPTLVSSVREPGRIAPPPAPLTMSVEDAAKALGIGRSLAYRMTKSGEIPTVKLGRRLLVPVSKLEEMLAR